MRADIRIKLRRSFRIRNRSAQHATLTFDRLAMTPANSGNRGSCFRGDPALTAGLIEGGHNLEVSTATDYQAIFIWWAWDSSGDFHELAAGGRARIHVVADHHAFRRNAHSKKSKRISCLTFSAKLASLSWPEGRITGQRCIGLAASSLMHCRNLFL